MPLPSTFSLAFALVSFTALAQKEANVWHFGHGYSLDFNSGTAVQTTGSAMETFEGCTAYGDSTGNLLFYSNGGGRVPASGQDAGYIWNKNNEVMYDMQGLEGGGWSAAQSSVVVPAPGEQGVYYLFTMDEAEHYIDATPQVLAAEPNGRGLRYFKVDMSLNGGLGGVVQADQLVYDHSYEGLCAIRHANGEDYWILINQDTTGIGVYSVTPAGVALSSVYPQPTSGIIKASPTSDLPGASCCDKVVTASGFLFDFDINTGTLSNPVSLDTLGSEVYEFSPDNFYLYATKTNPFTGSQELVRYDLLSASQNSLPVQSTLEVIASPFSASYLQLAPDGKIYFTQFKNGQTSLGTINCPNTSFPTISTDVFTFNDFFFTLPNFPAWILYNGYEEYIEFGPDTVYLCQGDTLVLTAGGPDFTYEWGGQTASGVPVINSLQQLVVTEPGTYSATVSGECGSGSDQVVVLPCAVECTGLIVSSADSCLQDSFFFSLASSAAVTSASWSFGDPASGAADTSASLAPAHVFSAAGTYEVRCIAEFSCGVDTLFKTLTIVDCDNIAEICQLYVPNVFSPNADGINDEFQLFTSCLFEEYELLVFNRWGGLVYQTSDQTGKWEGDCQGADCPDGAYVFTIRYKFPLQQVQRASGSVTLLR
jgi:gliding motility-associated-like protein